MKRFLALLVLVLISSNYTFGQAWPKLAWYKTYNGSGNDIDVVRDVKLHSRNFYLAGSSTGIDANPDLLVLKYSDKGDSLLGISYAHDPLSWDYAASIAVDSDENVYVVGSSLSDTVSALFHKYSSEGNLIFAKNFNSNIDFPSLGDFVTLDSNEDPIIGYRQGYNSKFAKITKYSSSGDSIWTVTITDDTSEYAVNYLLTDQDNSIYACLQRVYTAAGSSVSILKAVLVKISEAGEILWKTTVNGELPAKIILDSEQNVIMISKYAGSTIKFNSGGDKLWTNDSTNSIYPIQTITDIVVDSKNNIIVTGYGFGINSEDYITKKISPDGVEIWADWFDQGLNDHAMGIAIDDQDNLYVTGGSQEQDSTSSCYTVTYPADGAPGWVFIFNLSDTTFEAPFRIFIGDSNFVYVAGFTVSGLEHDVFDIFAFKIDYGYGNDVRQLNNNIPGNFSLSQNYPNPFNPVTKINFSIPEGNNVKIDIYDALGRLVDELVSRYFPGGNYSVDFDASELSGGVYFYRLTAGSFVQMKKAVLLK